MMHSIQQSPMVYTRIAGICYLLIIVAGFIGQIFIRGSLIVPSDALATVNNLVASPLLWRMGIVGDVFMHIFDIPMMVILYLLLKPINKSVALLGLAFNLIQTAVLVMNKMALILPLLILGNTEYAAAFTPSQINAQIMLLIDIHNYGFGLGLIFFGFACLSYGYLIYRSEYFPKFIGIFILIAGCSYLISSFTLILLPEFYANIYPVLVLCLIAELTFALWLVFKGVDFERWKNKTLVTG